MSLSQLIPPTDLLQQVGDIERGLRQRRRLSVLGWGGALVTAAVQVTIIVARWLQAPESESLRQVLARTIGQGPFLIGLGLLGLLIFIFLWNKFWLKESRTPFRYTFSVSHFERVGEESWADLRWLRHDLETLLSERVGRLSLREAPQQGEGSGSPTEDTPSHIHIEGHYGVRVDPRGRRVIEVLPKVRVGTSASEETLARPVRFPIEDELKRKLVGGQRLEETDKYFLLRERVYFSVSSEIYRQIRSDVEKKIALLPTKRFRRTAYFREAEDYARSATVDAYADARKLYDSAFDIKMFWGVVAGWGDRQGTTGTRARHGRTRRGISIPLARAWPRFAASAVQTASAATGYADVLLYGSILAALSGRGENQRFEARRLARWAIDLLEKLPPSRRRKGLFESDPLFDAYVAEALAWALSGSPGEATARLDDAHRLRPSQAELDARYLFVAGETEVRLLSSIPRFRRAAELEPRFEIAQFELATSWELLWRTRAECERTEAYMIIDEYDRVLELNPSNIGAWANRGYMLWLLGDLDDARDSFMSGLDYKEVRRETVVAELEYGLARVAAEKKEMEAAYRHYTQFVAAVSAETGSVSSFPLSYYFEYLDMWMAKRFDSYRSTVQDALDVDSHRDSRERRAIHAFVLNDWGESRFFLWLRSREARLFSQARLAFEEASSLNPRFVMPWYNLAQVKSWDWEVQEAREHLERVVQLEPGWAQGLLAKAEVEARLAKEGPKQADRIEKRAADLEAQVLQAEEEERKDTKARAVRRGEDPIVLTPVPGSVGPTRRDEERFHPESERLRRKVRQLRKEYADFDGILDKAVSYVRRLLPHDCFVPIPPRPYAGRRHLTSRVRVIDSGDATVDQIGHPIDRGPESDRPSLIDAGGANVEQILGRAIDWERDMNDLNVGALVQWITILSQSETLESLLAARKLCHHIRFHFYEGIALIDLERLVVKKLLRTIGGEKTFHLARRLPRPVDLQRELDDCKRHIRQMVANDLKRDPGHRQSLTWLDDEAFEQDHSAAGDATGGKLDLLRAAISGSNRSGAFLLWLGTRLVDMDEEEAAVEALQRAARFSTAPGELRDIGQQFERLRHWDESLEIYRRLQAEQTAKRGDDGAKPQRALASRVAFALWARRDREEAVRAFEAAAEPESAWRTDAVLTLLDRSPDTLRDGDLDQVRGPQAYRHLKDWLEDLRERARRKGDHEGLRDAVRALLHLVNAKYLEVRRESTPRATPSPYVSPVVVLVDPSVVPQEEGWDREHPLFGEYLPRMRDRIYAETGVKVPFIRMRPEDLEPNAYLISIKEVPVASGQLVPWSRYCPGPDPLLSVLTSDLLSGQEEVQERPLSGLWLQQPEAEMAARMGVDLWDHFEYLVRHLELVLRDHLTSFLGVQDVEDLLMEWAGQNHGERWRLGEKVLGSEEALVRFELVLRGLARERVPVRNLEAILKAFVAARDRDPGKAAEIVRMAICEDLPGNEGAREALTLPLRFERQIAQSPGLNSRRPFLVLAPATARSLLVDFRAAVGGRDPRVTVVVVRTRGIRRFVRRLTEIEFPSLPVLSAEEVLAR